MKEVNPPANPKSTAVVALVGGRLIDGRGGMPIDNAVVVIRGNRIIAAGRRDRVEIPEQARRINLNGMSVLPGLIDSHFHSRNNIRTPVEFELKHGITSFRDPGHPFRFYDAVLQSDQTMPRVFLCGGHLDAHPAVWPKQAVVIENAEHARRAVNAHVDRGASAIKIYFRLPPGHIKAACEAATERGVIVTAHLELVDADEAILAGVRGIEHVTSFGTALADPADAERFKASVLAESGARRALRPRLWASIDLDLSPQVKPLLETIVQRKVFVSPTLAIFERRSGVEGTPDVEVRGLANMLRFV